MWLMIALIGAVCTSLSTIFTKIGIKDVNSNFATAFRTGVVIIFSILLCVISGSINDIGSINKNNWLFLILSGIATGCSWLCYYKALKIGSTNKVVAIDKSSFIITSILFIIFFFNDTTNNGDLKTILALSLSMILMLLGTLLMIDKKNEEDKKNNSWLIYAILSAVFASFVSLFIKIGLKGINSGLGTLIRTIVVFIFALTIVLFRKDYKGATKISLKSYVFLVISGIATGGAWLSEYFALNLDNVNPIAVNSIGKFSILITMLFSFLILKEKFNKKSILGLILLTLGILVIIIFSL